MSRTGLLAISALLSIGFATAVLANDCKPLTLVTSLDMRIGDDGRIYVPVKINGVAKYMLIDTGGIFTEITQAAVDEIKLSTRRSPVALIDVSGHASDRAAHAATFTLGTLTADDVDFVITDKGEANSDVAGVIGPNFLRSYDIDIDMANRKLNFISQDHCSGKVIYWKADAVAVVPMKVLDDGHIALSVSLDGRDINAQLDTGADVTVLNENVAEASYGFKPGPDWPSIGHLPGEDAALIYRHTFKTLSLEGLAIANPVIDIVPDRMANPMAQQGNIGLGSRLPNTNQSMGLGDMLLGMQEIGKLHLYIAYKEEKLYITPAGAPPASAGNGAASQ